MLVCGGKNLLRGILIGLNNGAKSKPFMIMKRCIQTGSANQGPPLGQGEANSA
jgi:hypothetical protein